MSIKTAISVSEDDISALVDEFYIRVQHDAVIGSIFNEQVKDWPAHLALLKSFWAAVLLGTGRFNGNPLETHLKLKLEPQHFERWLALFRQTATELLPAEKADVFVDKSQRIAETFQRGIAARRDGLEIVPRRT
ncbi:MAG TPA: group III truncated hemoglobin [Acidobacteriaceae bacterium]|jgi:hemoglobin|nr:group III truncated hemoglobin [Acidobacteriaceae bacterium]